MNNKYNLDDYKFLISKIETESGFEYLAEFREFDFCCGGGETVEKAILEAKTNLEIYINEMERLGESVPAPLQEYDFSGKFTLRLSKDLHKKASERADYEGVSLNTFIVEAVGEKVGCTSMNEVLDKFERVISKFTIAIINTSAAVEAVNRFNNMTADYMQTKLKSDSFNYWNLGGKKLCKI